MRYLTPIPKQFVDQSGIPYSDGTVSVYLSGSDELADIFEDAEGDALCPNPCRLDSNGAWQCFVPGDIPLDYIVQDKHGNVVFPYYNIVPASGDGGVFTVKGTDGEIKVTNRVTASGRREATVGLDTAFKQRVDQTEDDIGDLNEEMRGVEGSIQELGEDLDHLDDRVEEAEGQIGQLSESLAGKKDRQTPVVFGSIPPNKTVKRISQDANGKMDVEMQDIAFPDYSQRFNNIENEQVVDEKVIAAALNDLNARMESVEVAQNEKNIGDRTADSLDAQVLMVGGIPVKFRQAAKSIDGATDKTVTNISQNENGVITVTYSAIAFPDWTGAITAATDLCEKLANKKTTFSGFETSDTYYPTLKAVVEYLDGRLQNLGGKKITNNGQPFTAASQLPTTTPYYGQNINSNDYAFVQDTGLASRYTAVVTGSSVAWSLDYEIAIPVFTAEQQAAIDSGANSTKIGNYDSHLANTNNPHGVTYLQVGASPDTHTHQVVINGVTKTIDKTGGTPVDLGTYLTSHQDLSNYLTKTGDGSDVTASFETAGSRNNISTGEKLSTIFGKIAKWFSDLKSVAFSGSYSDLSDKPTIPAPANNGVLTIKQNGTSKGTFSANQSSDTEINVTDTTYESKSAVSGGTAVSLVTTGEKYTWNAKQNAIEDLSDIRDGASKGETAVQPEDLATYMTNPVEGGVIAAALNDLNARMNALEYEDENIGDKIADKFDAQILRCGGVDVKTKQAAKESPSTSGATNAFIDYVYQDENGEISATKKEIQPASVSQPGIVQLNSTVVSTSTTQAATPSAVKAAYDLANGKQNPIGINSSSGDESLFLTQKGSWLPTPNEIAIIDNTYDVDSVLSLISAGKTPVYKYGANYLYNLEKYQESGINRFVTFTQSRLDNIYDFGPSGLQTTKVTYIYQSTVTTSGWSNDSYYTYGNESLVSAIASPYIDNVHFPTTKAVSDFVDQSISGIGGKQITDNGSPFTSSASLPSSTPYGGQNIVSNDYAYVQQGYTVTRYVASVNGSSVTWNESFSIDTSAFLTVPIGFTEAQTVENINANETIPTILGKIKKWFTDKISQLGNLAFLNHVGNAQISGTINDNHISSATRWNNKQNALPYSEGKYGISISGNADTATRATYDGAGNNIETMKAFLWDAYGAAGTTYDSNYYLGTDAFMFNSNYHTIRFSQNSSHNLPISGDWLGYQNAGYDAPPLTVGGWRECIVTIDLCLVYTSDVSEVVTVELVTSNGYSATAFCPRSAMRFITYSDGKQHTVNLHCEFTLRRDDKDISNFAYESGRPCKPAIKRVTNNGTVTVSYWSINTSVMGRRYKPSETFPYG